MYDRKTWIILALCGGMLAANLYFASKNPPPPAQTTQAPTSVESTSGAGAAEQPGELSVEAPPPPTEEETVTLESKDVIFTLSNIGGGIKYAEFKNEFEVGSKSAMVRANRFGSGPIGAIAGAGEQLDNIPYAYKADESEAGKKAVYIAKLSSGLIAKKTFTLMQSDQPGSSYLLDFELKVENTSTNALNLNQWSIFMGEASPLYQSEFPDQTGFFWHTKGDMHFEKGPSFRGGWFSSAKSIISEDSEEAVDFAGVGNQFFTTVLRQKEPVPVRVWGKSSDVKLSDGAKALTSVRAGIHLPSTTLQPNELRTLNYNIFVGPKHNPMLRKMEKSWGEGWGEMMQYGWFWFVSRPLNWLLNSYHTLLDGVAKKWAWGLAIILLTITVRFLIWPLHAKSTHTMKRMAKLQPEMAKLKEKYSDDPNKLNTEMMGLYRKFGINPLGGCLPMFLQIPIFFGFYKMLQVAVELRGQSFLWVNDLSQPDTLLHISFLGNLPLNILPIVMAITSFLQIKMTPKTGDPMQQRIIMFMPLIFFFFCYNFASALALYWTTQNIFSIGQTWLMNKVPEPELKARPNSGKKSWVQRMAEKQAEMQRLQKERASGGGDMRDVTPEKKKPRNPRTGG